MGVITNGINRISEAEATAFGKRIRKFRDSLVPGMSLTVYLVTGDQKIDTVPRKAKILKTYENWCLLQDDKGLKYGPTYFNLLAWGNC